MLDNLHSRISVIVSFNGTKLLICLIENLNKKSRTSPSSLPRAILLSSSDNWNNIHSTWTIPLNRKMKEYVGNKIWVHHCLDTKAKEDCKILSQMLVNWIQQHIKRIIHHDQVRSNTQMQGWLKSRKPISVINHLNKLEKKHI